ncbi:hypothetical protein [Microbulbifer elongatus]|uniref:hypothetical protein n=1 Tax=Microbulbifer elongatus TaxID=86173 RepID=UPI001E3F05C3|nr:hypothetical protein [Microbulbifer elongatus]
MKEFFIALKDNLSNVFSMVGIGLTVYFAVFYVPNYVEEIEIKKIESTHEALIESIQELVYNNHEIDSGDIRTLIRGKELSGNMKYPFTSEELLIQVQERFLENKFIPLEQRKALIEKLDSVRLSLPKPTLEEPVDEEKSLSRYADFLSWVSAILGSIAAYFGLTSLWSRNLKLEEFKIEETIENRQESLKRRVHTSMIMERKIYETLKSALGPNHVEYCPPSTPADFIIKMEGGRDTAVEVKYTETEVMPLRVINKLIHVAIEMKMPVVLISNANVTSSAHKKLLEFNSQHEDTPIKYINIDESKDIERDLKALFK